MTFSFLAVPYSSLETTRQSAFGGSCACAVKLASAMLATAIAETRTASLCNERILPRPNGPLLRPHHPLLN